MSEAIEYKDKFTLDGRLKPNEFGRISKAKVAKVKALWESANAGDRIADATLSESLTTSDAIFNAIYLANLQTLPQFDRLPRTWDQIATVRVLPDFRPAVLQGLFGGFVGLKRDGVTGPINPAGIAPVVAELDAYPYATISSVEAAYGQIKKRGFVTGWSWEDRINDSAAGFLDTIPPEMLQVALDSEEWEVYNALISGVTAGQQLQAGTTYSGGTVPVNSPLSRDAVLLGLQQLSLRQVNGRYIGQSSNGYNLIVPIGASAQARFILSQSIVQRVPGSSGGYVLSVADQDAQLGSISIVESQYVTGTNWYLLPRPGGNRRPVLELGRLRGHEAPELRVNASTGDYLGGGRVDPFEGDFVRDSIDIRLRYPITGVLWFANAVLWSNGTGA